MNFGSLFFYFTSIFFVIILFYYVIYFIIYIILYFSSKKKYQSNRIYNITKMDESIKTSPFLPGISVVAPAFNEGLTIIQNVKSLLSLDYPLYEIIIVNDGSNDDSLEKLIREFSLVPTERKANASIPTAKIRGYYQSSDPKYSKLIIIDKENAKTKADASNAGLNICNYPYILATDVDCILATDTLWTLIKPILFTPNKRMLGVGASIKLTNSSEFDNGKIVKYVSPREFLPRHQEVEYLRSFNIGKVGLSQLNSVMNISGALGLWELKAIIDNGGYTLGSLGEDMELTVKLEETMIINKEKYHIEYLHNTICWTEAPATLKMFIRQRTRWAIGLLHALKRIKGSILNPKRKQLGLIVTPFILLYEILGPFVEILGYFVTFGLIISGTLEVRLGVHILLLGYLTSLLITFLAIKDNLDFFNKYNYRDYINYYKAAMMEPFFYHQLLTYSVIKGFINYAFGKGGNKTWIHIERTGFDQKTERDPNMYLGSQHI